MALHTPHAVKLDPICLPEITLAFGAHSSRDHGLCALEVVAWLAGEEHSDSPECVSPVIAAFCRRWNDALPSDEDRNRLLRPLLPLLLDTRSGAADEETRAWLCTDWLVRVQAPAWMDLVDVLRTHGEALRALQPLTGADAANVAQPTLDAAWAAAGTAAETAAWTAAGTAAWAAAGTAAWAAATEALASTVATLQDSAVELVRSMCAIGKEPVP